MMDGIDFRQLAPGMEQALGEFFCSLDAEDIGQYFHPHPLTCAEALRLCNYCGRDFYCVVLDKGRVVGYGMLRGWDEGYSIPSLGIAVRSSARGAGIGESLMHYLHDIARLRGACQVILKVHENNTVAKSLYEMLGYRFQERTDGHFLGRLDL